MRTRATGFKIVLIAIIVWIFVVPSDGYAQMEQMEKKEMDMGPGMKMEMYKVAAIDGCSDFHCMKCPDRNLCSREGGCSIDSCGHEHAAVLCHGGILFYLRESHGFTNEAGQKSCYARAKNVSAQLNMMMNMMESHDDCYFLVRDEDNAKLTSDDQSPAIWFTMKLGEHGNKVLTVTPSDLEGYRYRASLPDLRDEAMSPNLLTKKMVAQWWAYTLKDHFTMMVLNEKPYLTTYTKSGAVLKTIYKQARAEHPEGKIPMMAFTEVANNLSPGEKANLFLAAQIVPKDFDPDIR